VLVSESVVWDARPQAAEVQDGQPQAIVVQDAQRQAVEVQDGQPQVVVVQDAQPQAAVVPRGAQSGVAAARPGLARVRRREWAGRKRAPGPVL